MFLNLSMNAIQKADPDAKRKVIRVICIALFLGVCAIIAFESFQDEFQAWLERNINFFIERRIVFFLGSLALVSPVVAAGTFLLRVGNRTVRAQRFPPPDYSVVRDTIVLEGAKGIQRGRFIQLAALLLFFCAALIPFYMWQAFCLLASKT